MSMHALRGEAPEPGGRAVPALRFRLFGFPVQAHASFLLIAAMLGFGLPAAKLATWVGIAALAVLGHELGHALAARSLGAEARIELAGLGGLTHWKTERSLSRAQQAFVTAAGPGAGFLLGIPVIAAGRLLGWEGWTTGGFALQAGAWATIGWSVLNLVPILPLDGGSLLELALPGDLVDRRRNAAKVGMVVGGAAAVISYRAGMQFTGLFALMLAAQNFSIVKHLSDAGEADTAPGAARQPILERLTQANDHFSRGNLESALALARPVAADTLSPDDWRLAARSLAGLSLVGLHRADEAVAEAKATRGCPEGVRGYALATAGDSDGGLAAARRAYAARGSKEAAAWLVETLMATRRFDEAADFVEAEDASLLPSFTAWRLMAASFGLGAFTATGRIGDALAAASDRPERAPAAYNAACGWSRASDTSRALASLETALNLGWTDLAQMDGDPDLAALRARADWPAFRSSAGTPV